MANEHHWIAGSGMIGCLYDWGPEFFETRQDAIESALFIFDNLEEDELKEMELNLGLSGIHYFRNPSEAGAHYVEVSRANGPCPESEND